MKIQVLIKQVPDTETQIKIKDNKIIEENIKWIISPFDEQAIEEAIRKKETESAEVEVVSLGPKRVESALRTALGFGADRATHLLDEENYNPLDINYTGIALATYCKKNSADIILCGHTAIDSQSSMIPTMLGEHLARASITNITAFLKIENELVVVHQENDGDKIEVRTKLPVILSVAKKINEPRYPSLKSILAAKKKPIEMIAVDDLNLSVERITVVKMELPQAKPKGKIIEGESVEEKASILVKALAEEVKVL